MSYSQKATCEEELEFKWGKRKASGISGETFYESFIYDGTEYFLYDCIYLWRASQSRPDIGKVIRIFETQNLIKKVRVVWFFRPSEVHSYLKDDETLENELFLASGDGTGLSNVNPLLAIAGKCNVICTSEDRRNPPASHAELRTSDFIFNRTFDVGSCTLSYLFPDKIYNTKVENFFNRNKNPCPESKSYAKEKVKDPTLAPRLGLDKPAGTTAGTDRNFSNTVSSEFRPFKKRKFSDTSDVSSRRLHPYVSHSKPANGDGAGIQRSTGVTSASKHLKFCGSHARSASCLGEAKRNGLPSPTKDFSNHSNLFKKIHDIHASSSSQIPDSSVKMGAERIEVTRRPNLDSSRWFKQKPWEERMWRADQQGTLVLLENLLSSCSASDVQDIVWRAVNQKVEARLIETCAFSSQSDGKALVIFESKEAAESAITMLTKRCLMLSNHRPLVAQRGYPIRSDEAVKFCGHLVLNRMKFQSKREEMRTAVSTSHCSQPNNVEYEMALEWKKLEEKTNMWWKSLHKKHQMELEELQRQLQNTYKQQSHEVTTDHSRTCRLEQ